MQPQALRDFDAAYGSRCLQSWLRLDPEDANVLGPQLLRWSNRVGYQVLWSRQRRAKALKYREIARKRVREADMAAEEKRRRTVCSGPLVAVSQLQNEFFGTSRCGNQENLKKCPDPAPGSKTRAWAAMVWRRTDGSRPGQMTSQGPRYEWQQTAGPLEVVMVGGCWW
eukprot:Skav232041  [mRNA]  locus=scaffold5080:34461:36642:- [translate_table: standard]